MEIPDFNELQKQPEEIVKYLVNLKKEVKNNALEEAAEKVAELVESKMNSEIRQIRNCNLFLPRTLFSHGILGNGTNAFYKR